MEVNTGAYVSLMSERQFKTLQPTRQLRASSIRLSNYSNEPIPVVGEVDVKVMYEGQVATLPLVSVGGDGPTLFGCNSLQTLRLNWSKVHFQVQVSRMFYGDTRTCFSLDCESTRDSRLESMSTPRRHPDSTKLELFHIRKLADIGPINTHPFLTYQDIITHENIKEILIFLAIE